jgi:hypothetical protein
MLPQLEPPHASDQAELLRAFALNTMARWASQLAGYSHQVTHAIFAECRTVLARIAENERRPLRGAMRFGGRQESADAGWGRTATPQATWASIAVLERNTGFTWLSPQIGNDCRVRPHPPRLLAILLAVPVG